MNYTSKQKRKGRIITAVVVLFFVILAAVCGIYLNDYYHADVEAIEAMTAENEIVCMTLAGENLIWEPEEATKGLIFYPGGKVEYTAYIPLMQACAAQDILCVLVKMPFQLAVLDKNAADGILETYPEIREWYIGGHSLGGSMAASYLVDHADAYKGLFLLGSYSTADLSETDLKVLSVFGSEDQVMNHENYDKNRSNLPDNFTELVFEGGCHAYFGVYGPQEGDGTPAISNEEQIDKTAAAITDWIAGMDF